LLEYGQAQAAAEAEKGAAGQRGSPRSSFSVQRKENVFMFKGVVLNEIQVFMFVV
jgi:hypothetical protein